MHKFNKALVTGASSGIGRALALLLADKGIHLLVTGRNRAELEAVKALCSQKKIVVDLLEADLATKEGLVKVVEAVKNFQCDLIINNAGLGSYGYAWEIPAQQSRQIIQVDVEALTVLCLEGIKSMLENHQKGVILNVSSAIAFFPCPSFSLYSASKAFVNQLTLGLDSEVKDKGIRVLVSCPGVVKTRFATRAGGTYPQQDTGIMAAMTPEFAAQEIWDQIVQEKKVHVFDWRYRWSTRISKLLPKALVQYFLRQGLKRRAFDK